MVLSCFAVRAVVYPLQLVVAMPFYAAKFLPSNSNRQTVERRNGAGNLLKNTSYSQSTLKQGKVKQGGLP